MSVSGDREARSRWENDSVNPAIDRDCGEPTMTERGKSTASTSLKFPDDLDWKAGLIEVLGQVIDGRYQLMEVVGTGGMGAVFKAHNRITNGTVAVKVLHPHLAHDGPSLRRFQLEAKAASRIENPNSISVHDYGVWEGQAYLVMDYLEGRSLADLVKRNGKLTPRYALSLFMQACDGLGAAHKLGIYHRDVKPSNLVVMEGPTGHQVKVCDFGLVKLKVQEGDTITGTGEVFGSPPYMSPEQCLGQNVDERSDVYSMGILMYETLTGVLPIKGTNPLDTMRKQVSVRPPALKLDLPDSPWLKMLADIIAKALAKEPEQRYQSMAQLKLALESAAQLMDDGRIDNGDLWASGPLRRINLFDHTLTGVRKEEKCV